MLPANSTPEELLAFVRDWFRILASGDTATASNLIDEPNCYDIEWTPQYIRHAIDLAFVPDCRFRLEHNGLAEFSDPDSAVGQPQFDVLPFDDGSGYSVHYDVPMNGVWSDLTAQFEFVFRDGQLAVILHDLHVM
jgi:hypothetical protein